MSKPIDGSALIMWLNDWWYSSFGQKETPESKAIHEVLDKVAEYVEKAEGIMSHPKIGLRDYILAMEKVREYERQLESQTGAGTIIARCKKCSLMYAYTITDRTKPVNAGGTSVYCGECPYCGERTEILRI